MIAVLITRAVPDHLRGYLGRYLSEVVPGVFVDRTSATVADRMWTRVTEELAAGSMAMVITDTAKEQGHSFRVAGSDPPTTVDLDGLSFIATRHTEEVLPQDQKSTATTDIGEQST